MIDSGNIASDRLPARIPAATVVATTKEMHGLFTQAAPPTAVWCEATRMEFVLVPAGAFTMGFTEEQVQFLHERFGAELENYTDATPRRTVALPSYYIGRYPVTQTQYLDFVGATGHPIPFIDEDWARPYNWDPQQNIPPSGKEQYPVVSICWEDAQAYCQWAGLQLPSEPQWEKAASWDPVTQRSRVYPWGDNWAGLRCNSAENLEGRELPSFVEWNAWWQSWLQVGMAHQNHDTLTPVGAFSPAGNSPYGCVDMAGNVWEWCADWYQGYPGTRCRSKDFGETYRVLRGGSRYTRRCRLRAAYRDRNYPDRLGVNSGFRVCLANLPEELGA